MIKRLHRCDIIEAELMDQMKRKEAKPVVVLLSFSQRYRIWDLKSIFLQLSPIVFHLTSSPYNIYGYKAVFCNALENLCTSNIGTGRKQIMLLLQTRYTPITTVNINFIM